MRFLNLGNKDEYGRQRRIEHRGKYLRASRTGGVALRAQAKAAGVNVTANTSRGFRVGATPLKNTQVAFQNGRFVLRGRYGRGPARLNLSKTGVSLSTRNRLGAFNWTNPNRSSARIAGVQMRGKNAAQLQMVYMLLMTAVHAARLAGQLVLGLIQVIIALLGLLYRVALGTPYALRVLRRRLRNRGLARTLARDGTGLAPPVEEWNREALLASLVPVLGGWGRGRAPAQGVEALAAGLTQPPLADAKTAMSVAARRLHDTREQAPEAPGTDPRAIMAALATRMQQVLPGEEVAEAILQADELSLEEGPRTRLQEQLLEVFADFAGIRFQEEEVPQEAAAAPGAVTIDLNTASLDELEQVPHLGTERAREVIARRPFNEVSELAAIDGIGPKRLEAIRAFGVVCKHSPETGGGND